jgi:hypothetical protein
MGEAHDAAVQMKTQFRPVGPVSVVWLQDPAERIGAGGSADDQVFELRRCLRRDGREEADEYVMISA